MRYLLTFLAAACMLNAAAQTGSINPGLQQQAPTPSDCPTGKHWTTQGSGIAHCVLDDPACPAGTTELIHDALGNPSCFTLVKTTEEREVSCTGGKVGYRIQERTATTHANGTVDYSTWKTVYSDCSTPAPPPPPPPAPSCSNSATNYPACDNNGGGGSTTPSTPPPSTCANGASDYPACTPPVQSCTNGASNPPACSNICPNGANNWPICSAPPPPVQSCTNGASNPPACNNICPNGANNWPICSVPPPPVVSCPADTTKLTRQIDTGWEQEVRCEYDIIHYESVGGVCKPIVVGGDNWACYGGCSCPSKHPSS